MGPVGTERLAALAGEAAGEAASGADKTGLTPTVGKSVVTMESVCAGEIVMVRSDVALDISTDEAVSMWMLISRCTSGVAGLMSTV